jgi:hypothetical protein
MYCVAREPSVVLVVVMGWVVLMRVDDMIVCFMDWEEPTISDTISLFVPVDNGLSSNCHAFAIRAGGTYLVEHLPGAPFLVQE